MADEERYSDSSETILRCTKSDNDEGLDLTLMFEWKQECDDDETYFAVTYTASTDDDRIAMVSGQPRSDSYRKLLEAARDMRIKRFELIIDTAALPRADLEASATIEASIHIEFDGPMGFRKFILQIANELPPEKDREPTSALDESGPSVKDRIN